VYGHRLGDTVTVAPVDRVRVDAEGQTAWFVAHLVARRGWLRGEVVAAMNAQFLGDWDVAPRAHPNDGRVDVVRIDPSMSLRDRLRARSRVRQGTHVPHRAITVRQVASADLTFARPMDVYLDGQRWLRTSALTLTVEPDALTIAF
jgi:diacylglycerol kinase family enzyme